MERFQDSTCRLLSDNCSVGKLSHTGFLCGTMVTSCRKVLSHRILSKDLGINGWELFGVDEKVVAVAVVVVLKKWR